jgi:hypothetical protein
MNEPQVLTFERMTVLAVRSLAPSLETTSKILTSTDRLQMPRIAARPVSTEMVEIHARRDRPVGPLVDHSMSAPRVRLVTAAKLNNPISLRIERFLRRDPTLVLAQNLPQNKQLRRERLDPHFFFAFDFPTPLTRSRFGFFLRAFAEALRAPAARIAPARSWLIPWRLAICDWAALKPIPRLLAAMLYLLFWTSTKVDGNAI